MFATQLKKAIREAKAFGLIGKKPDPSGATYIEERLRDAILALGEAEKRKKQQDGLANLVSEREKCFVRTVPLGEDREGRRLWHFAGDEPRVWVQEHSSSEVCDPGMSEKCEEDDVVGEREGQDPDKFLGFCRQEYFSDKGRTGTPKVTWTWYAGEDNLRQVLKALNDKGRKEKSLKENLREVRGQNYEERSEELGIPFAASRFGVDSVPRSAAVLARVWARFFLLTRHFT